MSMDAKPDIVETMFNRGIHLRRCGKGYIARCPLHDDGDPSMSVSDEKGLFHCFGCGAGGDVIDFIMKLDKVSFVDACRVLGIDSERKPQPPLTSSRKRAAEVLAMWSNEQRRKLDTLLRERFEQRDLADELDDFELAEIYDREIVLLRNFYNALERARGAAELLAVRESIEQITAEAVETLPPAWTFPALTPAYRALLKENPLDFSECFR